ncbi:MAG: hypothetical protein DHS20C18_17060 [Saprospiraceae bacterium]|nr:MAG: hypothetical protein DHS20C18_17060 [Saprospiraceae bacterium]
MNFSFGVPTQQKLKTLAESMFASQMFAANIRSKLGSFIIVILKDIKFLYFVLAINNSSFYDFMYLANRFA